MKIDDRFGSIEKGKQADLVIFDKNPLENAAHYRADKTIIKQGSVIEDKPSLGYAFKKRIDKNGIDFGIDWFKRNRNNKKYRPTNPVELNEMAFRIFSSGRPSEGIAVYELRDEVFPDAKPAKNSLDEGQMNALGYEYLGQGKISRAIAILKYATEKYPKSGNAFDSLGEAYLANDNKSKALLNYKKSVELDPKNANGQLVVNRLEGNPFKVDEKTLASYVGEYILNDNVSIFITIKGGKLSFQATRQPTYDLEAISMTQFVIPNSSTNVIFETKEGNVSAMLLNQGSSQTRLERKR